MLQMVIPVLLAIGSLPLENPSREVTVQEEVTPPFLYKILSTENWAFNRGEKNLKVTVEDQAFIHFSREDQVERTASKFFSNVPEYVILKIETAKLLGKLVYESNPGGTVKYYHLYDGSIPLDSVVEATVIKN